VRTPAQPALQKKSCFIHAGGLKSAVPVACASHAAGAVCRSAIRRSLRPLHGWFPPLLVRNPRRVVRCEERVAFKPGATSSSALRERSLCQSRRRPGLGSRRRLSCAGITSRSNGRRRRFASGAAGAGSYKEVRGRGRAAVQNCERALFARPPQQRLHLTARVWWCAACSSGGSSASL
jgi:hypothetical protein